LERHPGDHRVSKRRWGAFIGTSLEEYLRQGGVTRVLLTGIATGGGVESTARSAYDHGSTVALVVDAMTDRNAHAHRRSVANIFSRLGKTDTTGNLLKLLKQGPAR
jgi:nicotinamidase-related amidase